MAEAGRYQHYEVLRTEDGSLWELGRGAMGITYKAFDTNLRSLVALKVINSTYLRDDVARQRFLREARAAAALRHQNVASVFHLGTDNECYFYAMEFVDGETVDGFMKQNGPLSAVQALGITLQVSRALAAAAKQQLVHRDLKPANLMLVDEEGEKVVKVIDFGLAKSVKREGEDSATLTVGGGFVGTPHFASPEQLEERDIDTRSDIYALGATLYYMITGRPPYSGSVAQIMSQHLYKPLPLEPLEGSPSCLVELIQRMMDKDRAKRPQTPAELRQDVLRCLEQIRANATGVEGSLIEKRPLEQPDTLATQAFSTERPGQLGTGSILAQRYQILRDLGDIPQGRRFLADDIQSDRKVSLVVFNREFLSDSKRYTALEQEVDQLHRARQAELREVYSLESDSQQSFLVEEYLIGPTLLDILRIRSMLTPPETLLLINLLAVVADHAQAHRLQQVLLTVSGVHLASPGLTENAINPGLLQKPLTEWSELGVKVESIDFSLSTSDSATWAGSATLVQNVSGDGPRASYLRMLSLLAYELLGGPRSVVEATGRYKPIAALSEEGNAILRKGLVDELPSSAAMARFLEDQILNKVVEPVAKVATVSPPPNLQSGSVLSPPPQTSISLPPIIEPQPPTITPRPPTITPPPSLRVPEKRKISVAGLLLVFGLAAVLFLGLGFGGYALYRYFVGHRLKSEEAVALSHPPTPEKRITPSPTPTERVTPLPTPEERIKPSPTLPEPSEFQEKLATAQQLGKSGDWQAALKAYLELIDQYPTRPLPIRRLENMLAELRSSQGKLDAASYAEAKPDLVRAAEKGILAAMLIIGQFSRESEPAEALKWFELAAAKGSAPAMIEAGLLYSNLHQTGDYRKALEYFLQAASLGDRIGKYLAGECYYYGKGTPIDIAKAVEFLQEAAALREPRAMDLLGTYNRKLHQFDQARKYYEDAAAAGYPLSLSNLGVLYMNGEGVQRSPEVAVNLFKQGAEKGDPTAMFFYANCLQDGVGLQKDTKAAAEWFRRSARAGSPRAIEWCRLHGISLSSE
jgi:serine/threonine protein kinase/TPR repeat protein